MSIFHVGDYTDDECKRIPCISVENNGEFGMPQTIASASRGLTFRTSSVLPHLDVLESITKGSVCGQVGLSDAMG
jgi:hypothetical protein